MAVQFETFPSFEEDMKIIQKLGDHPNSDDLLSSQALKEKFDEGGIKVKAFLLNTITQLNKLVGILNQQFNSAGDLLGGGTMRGNLNMNGYVLSGISSPNNDSDAVNKRFVSDLHEKVLPKSGGDMAGNINMGDKKVTGLGEPTDGKDAVNKKYVDDKHLPLTATITTEWTGDKAPFTQTVAVEGILKEDWPHVMPVYSEVLETALAEKEAWACVSDAKTVDGSIVFICFEDKPTTAITIQIEVNR